MRVSVILTVHNSKRQLRQNFGKVYAAAKRLGSFEIIIAEDGSTDGSRELAAKLARMPNVKLLSYARRLGRGGAIKNAVRAARGKVIGYMDVDLSTPLSYLPVAVKRVESGTKVVIGSRYAVGSASRRTARRLTESKGYNFLLWLFFGSTIKDHQCGFKFWNAAYIKREAPKIKDNHWFFDSEMLIRAQRNGVEVYELPVSWAEHKESKVTFSDIFYFIGEILRLKLSD